MTTFTVFNTEDSEMAYENLDLSKAVVMFWDKNEGKANSYHDAKWIITRDEDYAEISNRNETFSYRAVDPFDYE